ncbi:MAG TPA: sigma-70 family RNA polymerase sigma factor [Chroococcales cyanobacterium]
MSKVNYKAEQPQLRIVSGSNYSEMADADLVLLCQRKDKAAFEALVKRHQKSVYAMFYRLAPDWSDSSDLAQEVWIRIWRGIDRLQNPKAFKSWMLQIGMNLFYDELRKRPKDISLVSLDQPVNGSEEQQGATRDVADPADGPEELYHRQHIRHAVDDAIASLPRQFRTAIVLREIEDLPYDQIAKLTNADIGTVKSRISRARTKVQAKLRPFLRPSAAA